MVVDHGLIAPSKSSDVDHQPVSGSWENEEEGDTPTLEMEVSQLSNLGKRKEIFINYGMYCSTEDFRWVVRENLKSVHACARLPVSFV